MKIGITGGAGFLGINLAPELAAAGHDVVLVDAEDRFGRFAAVVDEPRVNTLLADLRSGGAALPVVDVWIHLAALAHVDYSFVHPSEVMDANARSYITILEAARTTGAKVVFTSSVEVYGGNDGALLLETDAFRARSPYAASKVGCEQLGDVWRSQHGVAVSVLRMTNLYGPWQTPDRVIPRLISQALGGRPSVIRGDRVRDFMYVGDAVRAIARAVERLDALDGRVMNISTGVGSLLSDVADSIGLGGAALRATRVESPVSDGRGRSLVASGARARSDLEWRPTTSLRDGVARTVGWYRSERAWWSQFDENLLAALESPRFLADVTRPLLSREVAVHA